MEAISITPVKAGPAPAGQQAQGELGSIFQEMLRESTQRMETPAASAQADAWRDRAPREREAAAAPVRPKGGDPSDRNDDYADDVTSDAASAVTEPRQASNGNETRGEDAKARADATAKTPEKRPTTQSAESHDADTATPDAKRAPAGGPDAVANDTTGATGDTTANAPGGGGVGAVIPQASMGTDGQASGIIGITSSNQGSTASTTIPPAASAGSNANPSAQAAAQSSATAPGSAEAKSGPAPASAQGFSAQVSITPAPLTSRPATAMGGGAAATTLAEPAVPQAAGPATTPTPTAAAGNSTPAGTNSANVPTAGGMPATAQNTPTPVTDGRIAVAQSASPAAAGNPAAGAASAAPVLESVPAASAGQTSPAATVQSRPGTTQAAAPGAMGEPLPGGAAAGQGGTVKSAQTAGPDGRSVQQPRTDLTANVQLPTQTPATAASSAAQSAQATLAQSSVPAGLAGDAKFAVGKAGQIDAASNQAPTTTAVATGGFTQPAFKMSDTGSQSRLSIGNPIPTDQVAIEIQKAVAAGKDHVRVRLHPAELGQIDVSLKVRHDGTIRAVVTADRPETFDLLQRDSRGLERALQDAGLKTDSGSLSFNLRGGEHNGPNDGQRGTGNTAQTSPGSDRDVESAAAEADTPPPVLSSHTLDIRV